MEGHVPKLLSSFQHLELLNRQVKRNDGLCVLSTHHHGPVLEAIHRMNDARCELAHHQIVQQLLLYFYQSNHRSDVRSSAMIFQLEPKVGQRLQAQG